MYATITTGSKQSAEAVAVLLHEKDHLLPESYARLDRESGGLLSSAIGRPDFTPTAGTAAALHTALGPRLFVLGLGTKDQFHANHLRAAGSRLTGLLHSAKLRSLRLELGPLEQDAENAARALGEGIGLGRFVFDAFKGTAKDKDKGKRSAPRELSVTIGGRAAQSALSEGLTIAESVNIARTLGATPPNVANPAYLADYCRKLARDTGLKCTIIDAARARSLNMGGLLAVGGAGSTPPALICLEHRPKASGRTSRVSPILLVGKAVTFDTGGYSIKPAESMVPMKYDKCGGMVVIGTMHAAARLGLDVPLVGLIPAAENLIGQTAYRPSDILRLSNGVTVEVNNTDAEGRLILADALAYGCKTYKPSAVIDLATLTGAIVVALGSWSAGVFCNDEELYQRLLAASEASGERIWRMPLWPEHRKHIKATHGDILNSGGREGAACTAAAFLSHFVARDGDFARSEKVPWAHIDIAGVNDVSGERDPTGIYPKGPTGFGVRLLLQMLAS